MLPGDVRLRGDVVDPPTIESIRSCQRTGPDGQIVYDLVAEVLQRRRVQQTPTHPAFDFYGGATVILDPHGRIRYIISKRIMSEDRVAQQRKFLQSEAAQRYWKVEENLWTLRNPDVKHMFEST